MDEGNGGQHSNRGEHAYGICEGGEVAVRRIQRSKPRPYDMGVFDDEGAGHEAVCAAGAGRREEAERIYGTESGEYSVGLRDDDAAGRAAVYAAGQGGREAHRWLACTGSRQSAVGFCGR
eukprot:gnl/TRDRNA2_/TRDRNA2_174497_c1_seq1.p3 gnl/TRDRNA2_/TRDRNA2_174497_c1~~gnl/TRDRNA2_/TRDRNA2_174497_c1_seq1.p3  ORF type:complete len:120 (+),score=18.16 gnl/TRDRNA2_/TRDRNA2_174497_c1_seq1:114-473(+)